MSCNGSINLLVRCLKQCGKGSPVRHRNLSALTLALLVPLLVSCRGSGPTVMLVPALPATRTQVRTAESFRVRVLVTLPDGTASISKNRVSFPAGSWITLVSEEEMNEGVR